MIRGNYSNDSLQGEYLHYFPSKVKNVEEGKIVEKGMYMNNLRTGQWTSFYPDGNVYTVGTYNKGQYDGLWKGLFVGMNYQFFTIRKYKKDPNLGNLLSKTNAMFFLVSAQFGYVFEFLKNKSLQIHPSVRIGGYTADDYYDSGIGKKFYMGTDLQIRYLIKRKIMPEGKDVTEWPFMI